MERRFILARKAASNALGELVRAKNYADPGDGTIERAMNLVYDYMDSLPQEKVNAPEE